MRDTATDRGTPDSRTRTALTRRTAAVVASGLLLLSAPGCGTSGGSDAKGPGDPTTSTRSVSTSTAGSSSGGTTTSAPSKDGRAPAPTIPDNPAPRGPARPAAEGSAEDPRAGLPIPSVYRITIEGEASVGSATSRFQLGGWVVVTYPYEQTGASGNDINYVDIGVRTDPSPILGQAGALWFGTNTSISAALGTSPAVGPSAIDLVTERRDDDVVYATLLPGLARVNYLNVYNAATGVTAQIYNVLEGTVSIRFARDGSSIAGRVDIAGSSGFGGPAPTSEYHAAITGRRYQQ